MAEAELDYRFKFAVVMAIYNTGNYLSKAIDSIVNQTIGFKDNVQLVLVNDGSEDNSEDICRQYHEKYPENIVFLNQQNSGQAVARNAGFKHANAKYVNFCDSDDYLALNALKEVYDFFEAHYNEIDVVAIPTASISFLTGQTAGLSFFKISSVSFNSLPSSVLLIRIMACGVGIIAATTCVLLLVRGTILQS